jgi:prepilin-type N-terminal cleavage/methylation domain-containing protein
VQGFALTESLVALVLLGMGLLGAASTMIREQAQLRATLLATQAADLAADLAEQLRAIPTTSARDGLLATWQQSVQTGLSGFKANSAQGRLDAITDTGGLAASHIVTILWLDPALHTPRQLELPVLLSPVETAP